jgi:diacylglycerol kinase
MNRKTGRSSTVRIAAAGLAALVREPSARAHLLIPILILIAGVAAALDRSEWLWIVVAVTLVWASEAFNTAIERLGDAVTLEHHPEIGVAKDVAAAGVLLCLLGAVLICIIIFWPHVARWVG